MVEFENVKFEFDITDADTFDAVAEFEKGWKAAAEKLRKSPSGDAIRGMNDCLKDFLGKACDGDVYGRIFGGRTSLAKAVKLWAVISDEVKSQAAEMQELISEHYN